MEKINIAELLKDCPKGMELDCVSYDNVSFDKISEDKKATYPIFCYITDKEGNRSSISFTENGCESKRYGAKCVIFPKGKTTWEGFVPPCKFKDGDMVVTTLGNIAIIKKPIGVGYCTHCVLFYDKFFTDDRINICTARFATEEEKQELFDAIKANGYKWNAETKTLEKLIEPKFKVGDRIQSINFIEERTIKICEEDGYWTIADTWIRISDQDDWELIPNKFDISTLKPFDKVLVRNKSNEVWTANFYSHYDATSDMPFICVGWSEMNEYRYCIPYEVNKGLLGTTNNPKEYGSE